MKLLVVALVICAAAAVTSADETCESDNLQKLHLFNGQPELMSFPCRYWALKRQKCGKYRVTLTPGNLWVGTRYRLNTLWMTVTDAEDDNKRWEGRTSNKIAVKFLNANGTGRPLFNQKAGSTMNTDDLFAQGIDDKKGAGFMKDKDNNFEIYFSPWHPDKTNSKLKMYKHSTFTFICKKDDDLKPFPDQMCGNGTKNIIRDMANHEFNLSQSEVSKRIVIYYHLFMNDDVTQMDERCKTAVDILKTNCTSFDRRLTTLKHCEEILGSDRHTECTTKYSCHPMDIFNACLRWGCGGDEAFDKDNKVPCEEVGQGIDLCPTFENSFASLTERLENANCFTDFLSVDRR